MTDSADTDELPAPTHWPALTAGDAQTEWHDLAAWVSQLQERFTHLDHHVIPRCWWRHNGHVEALSALRDHERVSFSDGAAATAPVDWFRALRDMTALLRAWTDELPCAAEHHELHHSPPRLDEREWSGHVAADIERRRRAEI